MFSLKRPWPGPLLADLVLVSLVVVVAGWLRLPQLQLVPQLTDEIGEIAFAYRIAEGGYWPTLSKDTYIGPIFHYLMAFGFWAGGGIEWPRFLSLILGALTVGLTYVLGSRLYALYQPGQRVQERVTGLVAALLMAVSFVSIVVSSHIAWSNATSPFWTTLFFIALVEVVRWDKPAGLLWVAVLGGLALQTHPSVIVFVVGGVVWLVSQRPAWLRTRWPWLALGIGIICISNLLLYTLMSGGESIDQASQRAYAWTGGVGLADYLVNVQGFLLTAYYIVGSTFLSSLPPEMASSPLHITGLYLYAAVALIGLVYTARRAGLPLVGWLVALVLLPYFNRRYNVLIDTRYLAPLLPLTFAAIGIWLTPFLLAWRPSLRTLNLLSTPNATTVEQSYGQSAWSRASISSRLSPLIWALCLFLVLYPFKPLDDYYAYHLAIGHSNVRLLQVVEALRPAGRAETLILIDRGLRDIRMRSGSNIYTALGLLLDLDHTPNDKQRVEKLADAPVGAFMVLTDERRDILASTLHLEPVDVGEPIAPTNSGGYWVYRVIGR